VIKDPNTMPIPAPHPANAIVAHPAPINFAAVSCIIIFIENIVLPFALSGRRVGGHFFRKPKKNTLHSIVITAKFPFSKGKKNDQTKSYFGYSNPAR
jgi:hypothetical protein